MRAFVADTGVDGFDHVQDVANVVWQRYEIRSQPHFAFIDDDGSVEITRGLSKGELRERIEALLAA